MWNIKEIKPKPHFTTQQMEELILESYKTLSAEFKIRVEMRQIGARQEALGWEGLALAEETLLLLLANRLPIGKHFSSALSTIIHQPSKISRTVR